MGIRRILEVGRRLLIFASCMQGCMGGVVRCGVVWCGVTPEHAMQRGSCQLCSALSVSVVAWMAAGALAFIPPLSHA